MKHLTTLIILILIGFNLLGQDYSKTTLLSGNQNIKYYIDNKKNAWGIMPEVNPDRLTVYCKNKTKNIVFKSDMDSVRFNLTGGDTIRFRIKLQKTGEFANTEIVGVNELPNTINLKDKFYYLSLLWSEAKYNFVSMDKITFSWDSLYSSYIEKLPELKNDYEYYRLLQSFYAKLNDGHTQVSSGGQFSAFTDYFSALFVVVNKKVYMVNIRKDAGVDSTWLGAELIKINDIPTHKYLTDSVFPYISASTSKHRFMQAIYRLHADLSVKDFYGTIKKKSGEEMKLHLPRNGEETRHLNIDSWKAGIEREYDDVSFKWLKDSIAYIAINRFTDNIVPKFDSFVPEIKKSKALIIDIRYNGGGGTDVAWHIQSHLSKEDYFLNFAWETRINKV